MLKQRIVVKIGTNAMIKKDQMLDQALLAKLVNQIAQLQKNNDVLIVTSGAMGSGKTLINAERYDEITRRQMYAVVGQVKLMRVYSDLFAKKKIVVAQLLSTKDDFCHRAHFLNTKNCLESLFNEKIIPIMNENDFVAIEELMFTDNDELASLIAKMLCAEKLILLTNVDGVLGTNKKVISDVMYDAKIPKHIEETTEKSQFGKGGIRNKFVMACSAAEQGTDVYIANSRKANVLLDIMKGEKVGTHFKARKFCKL